MSASAVPAGRGAGASSAAAHRGGAGPPLVLLHGLMCSWHIWRPVLPELEREHRVFAPTLPGHRGGPRVDAGVPLSVPMLADAVERMMDAEGLDRAHVAGNSLGGWLSIELGRRGRALSVVALSPAGGDLMSARARRLIHLSASKVPLASRPARRLGVTLRAPMVRRVALLPMMERGDRVPPARARQLVEDVLECPAFSGFAAWLRDAPALARGPRSTVPIRVAWAARDRTIPFARYGRPFLDVAPEAEVTTMRGVGHVPTYDDPALVARTILDVTRRVSWAS